MSARKKSTALTLLKGNPGRKPLYANPEPPTPSDDTPPDWLDAEGAACWRRTWQELTRSGMLATTDLDTLALYCDTWSRYYRARLGLASGTTYATDTGYIRPRPEVLIVNTAAALLLRLARELGCTPAARSAIHATPHEDDDGELFDN